MIHKMFFSVHIIPQTNKTGPELKVIQLPVVVLIEVIKSTLHLLDLLLVDSLAVSNQDLVLYGVLLSSNSCEVGRVTNVSCTLYTTC